MLKRQFLLGFVLLFCHLVIDMPRHLDLFLTFIFHSSELAQGWSSGWLVPSRPSPSLLSAARGVVGRRKAKEREDFLPFSFPSPPAPAARITWRQLGRVRCSGGTLASHWCDPGSNPGVDATCGLSLLLVLSFAPRGFSPGTVIFPSP